MCPQVGFFKTWLLGVSGLMFLSDFYLGDSFICKPWWYEEEMKRAKSSFSFFSEHSNALLFCPLHHLDGPCHLISVVRRNPGNRTSLLLGGSITLGCEQPKKNNGGKIVRFFTTKLFSLLWNISPKKSLNRSLKVKHVSLVDSSVGKAKETGPWFTVELDDAIPLYYNYPV